MAQVQSGASADLWTIDPTSKGGRVTLYDTSGNELIAQPSAGSYLANINIRQSSAATGANALIYSIFNPSGSIKVRVRSIRVAMVFDGTAAAAGTSRAYYYQRTQTAAPTGGTAITPTKKKSTASASVVDLRFLDTGLTKGSNAVVGTALTDAFVVTRIPISATATEIVFPMPWYVLGERLISPIELVQNEGIGIFIVDTNTTVGVGLVGVIEWDESTS